MGTLDENFNIAISPKYDHLFNRYNGIYEAHIGSLKGFIDGDEQVILPLNYNEIVVVGNHYRCKR